MSGFSSSAGGERFITFFFALHDARQRARWTMSIAATTPLIRASVRTGHVPRLKGCPRLGMLDELPVGRRGLTLDGSGGLHSGVLHRWVVEQENEEGEAYGEHRLQQLVEENRQAGVEALNADIIVDWEQHRGNRTLRTTPPS